MRHAPHRTPCTMSATLTAALLTAAVAAAASHTRLTAAAPGHAAADCALHVWLPEGLHNDSAVSVASDWLRELARPAAEP